MAKFARIFELPNENQVLLTIENDEQDNCPNLKFQSEVNELTMSISLGFKTIDDARNAMRDCTQLQAEAMRNQMLNLVR